MTEGREQEPGGSGGDNEGVDADVAGRGDEGERAAQASPRIADDAEPGRTVTPAEDGEVGVPPDEEMDRPSE
jgi:hypothetical protein